MHARKGTYWGRFASRYDPSHGNRRGKGTSGRGWRMNCSARNRCRRFLSAECGSGYFTRIPRGALVTGAGDVPVRRNAGNSHDPARAIPERPVAGRQMLGSPLPWTNSSIQSSWPTSCTPSPTRCEPFGKQAGLVRQNGLVLALSYTNFGISAPGRHSGWRSDITECSDPHPPLRA